MSEHQQKLDKEMVEALFRRTDARVRILKQSRLAGLDGLTDHIHFAKNEFPSQGLVNRLVGRTVAGSFRIASATIGTDNSMRGFYIKLQSL